MNDFKSELSSSPIVLPAIIVGKDNISAVSTRATYEEALSIWEILRMHLNPTVAYGLAAVQLGILKKVGLVNYQGKEYKLLNTTIVETASPRVIYNEGCMSLPRKKVNTERFGQITIQDDVMGKVALDIVTDEMLPIIIQHEVDHFEGVCILDRQQKPVKNTFKIGRNTICPECNIKYKKCKHSIVLDI